MKKRALVIAPGRGTYNKSDLGYLKKYHADKKDLIATIDAYRKSQDQTAVSELDERASYSLKEHTRGDNASSLIYTCAYADYLSIDRERFDIVAITGNSMGWYIALGCAQALSVSDTTKLINTMGTMMQKSSIGGQLIYPFVDENWQTIPGKKEEIQKIAADINKQDDCTLYTSIELGGMSVFGGNDKAIQELAQRLTPVQDRFPLILPNHAAFHTPLQKPISRQALDQFTPHIFKNPNISLIDGRGHIWRPHATEAKEIYQYTLDYQVCQYYDFTKAVHVAMKEHAPDTIILLGPGTTLGSAVAQSLIQINWDGLNSKEDFTKRQASDTPVLHAMGIEDQRYKVTVNEE